MQVTRGVRSRVALVRKPGVDVAVLPGRLCIDGRVYEDLNLRPDAGVAPASGRSGQVPAGGEADHTDAGRIATPGLRVRQDLPRALLPILKLRRPVVALGDAAILQHHRRNAHVDEPLRHRLPLMGVHLARVEVPPRDDDHDSTGPFVGSRLVHHIPGLVLPGVRVGPQREMPRHGRVVPGLDVQRDGALFAPPPEKARPPPQQQPQCAGQNLLHQAPGGRLRRGEKGGGGGRGGGAADDADTDGDTKGQHLTRRERLPLRHRRRVGGGWTC
mmetsp:Transcript_57394/g.166148  ORF Transcript_57394/g.166148 Transcript_57394/m.166148 type:complete len:272 (-) Transcript_57394:40-855(-)